MLEGRRKHRGSTQGLETRLGTDETRPFLKVLVTEAAAQPHLGAVPVLTLTTSPIQEQSPRIESIP